MLAAAGSCLDRLNVRLTPDRRTYVYVCLFVAMSCSTSHCTHMHAVLVSCPRHCYTHYSLENAHVTEPQHVQPSLLPTIADLIDRLYVHTRHMGTTLDGNAIRCIAFTSRRRLELASWASMSTLQPGSASLGPSCKWATM